MQVERVVRGETTRVDLTPNQVNDLVTKLQAVVGSLSNDQIASLVLFINRATPENSPQRKENFVDVPVHIEARAQAKRMS